MVAEPSRDVSQTKRNAEQDHTPVQIGFYHLTRTTVEDALPFLLGRTLEEGERAVVRCATKAHVTALDKALWETRKPLWLPHGTAKMGYADCQPIWLSADDERPNGAHFLFRIDGAGSDNFETLTRVFDLFDGRDEEAVIRARQRWKKAKLAGYKLTYLRQEARGWRRAG